MRPLIETCRAIVILVGILCAQTIGAAADEVVTFGSARYLVGDLQQRLARERGKPLKRAPVETIKGYLSRPAGAGPFPAVIYLHPCGGLSAQRRMSADEHFTNWGYVTLVVDSFSTRGIKDACSAGRIPSRHADAVGALIYLSTLPFVDPKRIAVVGYSQGGSTALEIASDQPVDLFEIPDGLKFKAAVAYYPRCSSAADELAIPTLVFIGKLDDWSLASECERLLRRWNRHSASLKLVVFPEAYHSFDSATLRGTVRYYGHWLRYDPDATGRSIAQMRDFLAAQLEP